MSPKVGVAPLRRRQIVDATIRCLAREGYAALTMKKVAREAGAVILALVDGLSLQLTFDPNAFSVAQAARFCEEAVFRYLAKE